MIQSRRAKIAVVTGVLAMGLTGAAGAAPYVTESFDYTLGSSVAGQTGGSGFGSAWTFTAAGPTTPTEQVVAGLSLSGLAASGNAVQISSATGNIDNIGTLGRPFGNVTPGNSNLWGTYLVRQVQDDNISGGFGNGTRFASEFNSGDARKFFADAKQNDIFDPTYNARVGVEKNPTASDGNFSIATGVTYLVVAKFDNINYGAFTGNVTTSTLWILDQTDVDAVLLAGLSEAALTANNQTTFTSSFNPLFGTSGLVASEPLNLLSQNGSAVFDEIRWSTTLSDVVVAVPVPEPTALGIVGLCGLGMLRRRRRHA